VAPEATVIYLHDRDDYDATARRADLDLLREALRDEPDPVTRWHLRQLYRRDALDPGTLAGGF
jgi:hypothetical protein